MNILNNILCKINTVRGGILRLLGILTYKYKNHFNRNQIVKLSKMYTKHIAEGLAKANKMERQLVAGCLTGLEYFLNDNSDTIPLKGRNNNHFHHLGTIFKMAFLSISDTNNETRYNVVISSLNLFNRHGKLFIPFIIKLLFQSIAKKNDSKNIIKILIGLCNFSNKMVSNPCINCLESLVSNITLKLCENPNDNSNKLIFKTLFEIFKQLLKEAMNSNNNTNAVSIAIRGFGQLSSSIKRFSKDENMLQTLLQSMIKVSKKLFTVVKMTNISGNNNNNNKMKINKYDPYSKTSDIQVILGQFPSFISAFASIIYEVSYVEDNIIQQLSIMINMVFKGYIETWNRLRYDINISLIRLFVVLYTKGNLLGNLLELIVYPGIVYSITTFDTGNTVMINAEYASKVRKCYDEFYQFWSGLLMIDIYEDTSSVSNTAFNWNNGLNMDDNTSIKILFEMRQILFDSIIKNLITILNELNLKFKLKDKNIESNNSVQMMLIENEGDSNIILENSADMELFLNYTQFVTKFIAIICRKELKKYGSSKTKVNPYYNQFQMWSINFIEALIDKSINNECISGLYKLLQCIFKIYGNEIENNEISLMDNNTM